MIKKLLFLIGVMVLLGECTGKVEVRRRERRRLATALE
jgi:hypothetical protein